MKMTPVENHFFTSSNGLCVFNSLIPMPFRESARIEMVNDGKAEVSIWYQIDVEFKDVGEEAMYLHAYWQRWIDIEPKMKMNVLPEVHGKGRYLGTHWGLHKPEVKDSWPWYTRAARIFVDPTEEDTSPNLFIGTLDDFVCTAWWSREDEREGYDFLYTGRPLTVKNESGDLEVSFYRYHVLDPIWFHKSVSFTISGQKKQDGVPADWCSTAFFYLSTTESNLPAVQDSDIRLHGFTPELP